jgi:hypothetical protein
MAACFKQAGAWCHAGISIRFAKNACGTVVVVTVQLEPIRSAALEDMDKLIQLSSTLKWPPLIRWFQNRVMNEIRLHSPGVQSTDCQVRWTSETNAREEVKRFTSEMRRLMPIGVLLQSIPIEVRWVLFRVITLPTALYLVWKWLFGRGSG